MDPNSRAGLFILARFLWRSASSPSNLSVCLFGGMQRMTSRSEKS